MTYELTLEGLFRYFDPIDVQEIMELSLVKRHLSVQNYLDIKEACANPHLTQLLLSKVSVEPYHAILDFEILKQGISSEVHEYLQHEKVRGVYFHCYGEYFTRFETKHLLPKVESPIVSRLRSSSFNRGQEKILMLHIQASMALPLQAFTNAIMEQDVLLQEIASLITYQASQAQKVVSCIKADDVKYKQTVVNLAFSMVKMGLGFFNAGELVNISQSLADLATSAVDKMEKKLPSLVADIQNLVVHTHLRVLQEAEQELLSETAPEDITLRWSNYRAHIFHSANRSIKHVLDTCVNHDDFFRCVIKETLAHYPDISDDQLLLQSAEKARKYLADINFALQAQVAKIHHIRDAVKSPDGGLKVEYYFRKIGLINYAMEHSKNHNMIQSWLTKKLGHRLSFYFPDIIFQKKWTFSRINNLVYKGVNYCKQTLTLKEYQERKQNAAVVLGLFRNSQKVRSTLFCNLEEQKPRLHDDLIDSLQRQTVMTVPDDIFLEEEQESYRSNRYCFRRRRLSLFSFTEPLPHEDSTKSLESCKSVVLVSMRELTNTA